MMSVLSLKDTILEGWKIAAWFRRAAISLLTVTTAILTGCVNVGMQQRLATQVDAVVAPLVAANQFSGAIVLSRAGQVIYQRGFGLANRSAGLTFTPDTPSDGASLAKTFTAAAVWWLAYEGRIELDAPVTRYVAEYPHEQTTVRHLISHSNGLPPYYEFFDPYFAENEVRTTQALLRVVAKHSPVPRFQPGSRFEYSNLGFDVAALIIENVTGQSYETFLRERFFSGLGMQNTIARPARLADWEGVRTLGYRWHDARWQLFDVFDMEAFLGASNLYFSASDLGRWASANAAGTALPAKVFSAGQHRPLIGGAPSAITALSWYCDDSGFRCYYTGSLNAFHSLVYWDRERDESLALVTNSTMPPWQVISLQRNLVDALAGRAVRVDASAPFVEITREGQASAAGHYLSEGSGVATVEVDSAGLSFRLDCGLKHDMFQVSPDVFYVPGVDYWIGFGGGTEPTTMYLRSMFLDATLKRLPVDAQPTACGYPGSDKQRAVDW
ncbi:MAG: serine hydrolase domain-containing protein [Steroidobacteraceae bacterium]